MANCIHHWIIEMATAPKSKGRCKYCKTVRNFSNTPEDKTIERYNPVTKTIIKTRDINIMYRSEKNV